MGRKITKKQCQSEHARRRFHERYGIEFTRKVRFEMIDMIQKGHTSIVNRQSNRIVVHRLYWKGEMMDVVYDKNRNNIVTVLFPN